MINRKSIKQHKLHEGKNMKKGLRYEKGVKVGRCQKVLRTRTVVVRLTMVIKCGPSGPGIMKLHTTTNENNR